MRDLGRLLVVAGAALIVAGVVVGALPRLGLGRLPGDFVYRGRNVTFFFPLMTSLLLSALLSLLLWLLRR